jgi:hypothetical protein
VLGGHGVEQRNGAVQEKIVASGDDQKPSIGSFAGISFREIDRVGLHPLFHEMQREQPLAGDLGGGQPLLGDEGVNHLLIHIEELGHFLGR